MPARMQGIALVIVLFILTMMTVLITWLSDDLMLSIRRTENIRDSEQAYQLAIGSEQWGVSVLSRDAAETQTDHLGEIWNNLGEGVNVEEGKLETVIQDQQGRFNINNLLVEATETVPVPGQPVADHIWIPAFRRLLVVLELDEGLADAVLDWMDPDESVRGSYGAEDSDYLGESPPYRAANRMLNDVSELLWIKGFNSEVIAKLAPNITALPATGVAINVNTAPESVLRILGKSVLSKSEGAILAEGQVQESGYTVDQFMQHDMMAKEREIAARLIDDKSSYYLIQSTAQYGRARLVLKSLAKRDGGKAIVIRRRQTF